MSGIENEMDFEEAANTVTLDLLPKKSRERYLVAYMKFSDWCRLKNVSALNENVLLVYFAEKAKLFASSTMWSEYSMLKATLVVKENIDIAKMPKVIAFLKRNSEGYKPKKAKVFTRHEINKFLEEASDEIYLMMKVVLVMGVAGACRREELKNMEVEDIEDRGDILIVTIPNTKTKLPRKFTITTGNGVDMVKIYKKYRALRPINTNLKRFFLCYRAGKCLGQPVGANLITKIPQKIATYLKLPSPSLYNSHSLRRSSATLLVDAGADITTLKRHGGWRSTTVAESYIENFIENKIKIAERILGTPEGHISENLSVLEENNMVDVTLASSHYFSIAL